MKLYLNLLNAVEDCLQQIFVERKQADIVVPKKLKSNTKWGKQDRHFIAHHTYEIVRWWRLLTETAGVNYQRVNTKHIPELLWKWLHLQYKDLVISPTIASKYIAIDREVLEAAFEQAKNKLAVKLSMPDWLHEMGSSELGLDKWQQAVEALNQTADLSIRVNTMRTNQGKLIYFLNRNNIAVQSYNDSQIQKIGDLKRDSGKPLSLGNDFPDALVLDTRKRLTTLDIFKRGWFEIQDVGSQAIAPFLEVAPNQRVLDVCAGAGGKTLHLANLMKNQGEIIAMDIFAWKLEELRRRVRRHRVQIVDTCLVNAKRMPASIAQLKFDRILLDVPCSGLGTLRRNPDSKWKLSPKFMKQVRQQQARLLVQYVDQLKVGGKMVYATCSILPSENQEQIAFFLESQKGRFELEAEQTLLPQDYGFDGFYMARLRKKG